MKFYRSKMSILAASMALALVGCGGDGSNGDNGTQGPAGSPGLQGPAGEPGANGSSAFYPLEIYAGYPITLDPSAAGSGSGSTSATTSVSYKGQMARHVLREQLKKALKSPDVADDENATQIADYVNQYLKNENGVVDTLAIIAPVDENGFDIKEETTGELSSKSLYDSMYDTASDKVDTIPGVETADAGITMGVPGEKTAKGVADLWVENFARNYAATQDHMDMAHGLEYNQLMAKFMMGAVFYNQAVDKYLDEYMEQAQKPHSLPYKDGAIYSGKEHSWDEGFGYFGAAANYGILTPQENYNIKKQKEGYADYADWDADAKVSLYTEYTSGPAYYTADSDKDGKSTYGRNIMAAWIAGRELIADATDSNNFARDLTPGETATLKSYARTIQRNWEMVFAEAVYKYAGYSHKFITEYQSSNDEADLKNYYHLWSEGKGMMLALQYGGAMSKITKDKFMEIDNLLGYGPVLPDGSQVVGVSGNDFTKSAAGTTSLDDYKLKLQEVQNKLDEFYSLKTKKQPIS